MLPSYYPPAFNDNNKNNLYYHHTSTIVFNVRLNNYSDELSHRFIITLHCAFHHHYSSSFKTR
jgi:hypothetical protein